MLKRSIRRFRRAPMLVVESKMNEGEGLILSEPTRGLGYQAAGAFHRLGRRMIGILKSQDELKTIRELPMQTIVYDWKHSEPGQFPEGLVGGELLITPNRKLGLNES